MLILQPRVATPARADEAVPVTSISVTAPLVTQPRSRAERLRAALPVLALVATVVFWGLGPPLMKLVSGPPLTLAFLRLWMAVPLVVGLQLASGIPLRWVAVRRSMIGGVLFGLNISFMFSALNHASVATITVITALQPAVVGVAAYLLYRERLSRWRITWTAIAMGGACIAVLGAGAALSSGGLGLVLSLAVLFSISGYFLASKRSRVTLAASEYVTGVMVTAAVVVTIPALWSGGLAGFAELDGLDWLWLMMVLIFPGVLGHLLLNWAVHFLPLSLTSLTMIGSTTVSILAAWPINHQPVTLLQAVGALIALLSIGAVVTRP